MCLWSSSCVVGRDDGSGCIVWHELQFCVLSVGTFGMEVFVLSLNAVLGLTGFIAMLGAVDMGMR